MPTLAIVFGVILDAMGFGAYMATGAKTALIPCAFGSILFLCGIVAGVQPKLRMHVMHVAALTALIGTLGGLGMGLPKAGALIAGTLEKPLPAIMQIGMGVLLLIFLVLCVKSFVDARLARKAAESK